VYEKLKDDIELGKFKIGRQKLITDILQEFDNLNPSSLDLVFNAKKDAYREKFK